MIADSTWWGWLLDVDSFDADGAGGGALEAFDHFEGGGFAGAVGAEHAEGFAGFDGKGNAVDGGERAVRPLVEILDLNAGGHEGLRGKRAGIGRDARNGIGKWGGGTISVNGGRFNN